MKIIFGVDIGGTEIKIGKFNGIELIEKYSIKTDTSDKGNHIIEDACLFIKDHLGEDEIIGIGFGVPGPVRNGIVLSAPNIGWISLNVEEEVHKYFPGIKVTVGNDANMAALGEKACGGANDYESFVLVTLGTGIGGGVIVEGMLIEGSFGGGGEIGHACAESNGRLCTCGLRGCIERYASATGIVETANILRKDRETKLNEGEVTAKAVFDYAKQNDPVAVEVVDYSLDKLAMVLSQVATVINPEAFVIGGGVSKAGQYLIDILDKKFMSYAFPPQKNTKFVLAKLGNDAGIYGCAYAINKVL